MVRFPRGERAVGARHSFREPAIAARAVLLDEEPCPLTVRTAELERNALKMEEEAAEQARWVAETNNACHSRFILSLENHKVPLRN